MTASSSARKPATAAPVALKYDSREWHFMEEWDEIYGFSSLAEYWLLSMWVEARLVEHALEEVPVQSRYSGAENSEERWMRTPDEQIWRLVAPDFPFKGLFAKFPKRRML